MSTYRDPLKVELKNILETAFTGFQPPGEAVTEIDVHHGWVKTDANGDPIGAAPEITLTGENEDPINTVDTGYAGMDPANGRPTQDIAGTINVDCWTSRQRSDVNPRKLGYYMKEEVIDTVHDNYLVPTSDDYRWLSYMGGGTSVETDWDEIEFRHRVIVGYGYHRD